MFLIGIDVHKKQSQICILDERGDLLHELRVPTDRPNLTEALRPFLPGRVVLEACTPSEWVARHLEALGFSVVVADPNFAPMYATRQKKVKTDKRDARALAQALKLGAYKPAHRLSDAQRQVRMALDVRQTLVETRTKLINQIGALLSGQGYCVASGGAEAFARRVARLELPQELRATLQPLLTMLEPLNAQIAAQEAQLEAAAEADEKTRLLRTVPGVGPLTALMFAAVIDGASRFDNVRQVYSYLGLVPREQSSGERQSRGRITKAGAPRMRTLLVQAAQRTLRNKKPELSPLWLWATGIAQRRGKGIAAVALARRLGGLLWAMLRDGTPYQPRALRSGPSRRASRVATSPTLQAQAG